VEYSIPVVYEPGSKSVGLERTIFHFARNSISDSHEKTTHPTVCQELQSKYFGHFIADQIFMSLRLAMVSPSLITASRFPAMLAERNFPKNFARDQIPVYSA
jgi:hypothetical protein